MRLLSPIARVLDRLKRLVVGRPDRLPRRVIKLALVGSLAIVLAAGFVALRSNVATTSSSLTYLEPLLKLTTSLWFYAALVAGASYFVLRRLDRSFARRTAAVLGWKTDSVLRLALEAKSPDETTRVIATSDDEVSDIRDRILEALETGEDDNYRRNEAAIADPTETLDPNEVDSERYADLVDVLDRLSERADELDAELQQGLETLIPLNRNRENARDAIHSGADTDRFVSLFGHNNPELASRIEDVADELQANLDLQEEIIAELDTVEDSIARRREWDSSAEDDEATFSEEREELKEPPTRFDRVRSWLRRLGRGILAVAKVAIATLATVAILLVGREAGPYAPESLDAAVPTAVQAAAYSSDALAVAAAVGLGLGLKWARSRRSSEGGQTSDPIRWEEEFKAVRSDIAATLDLSRIIWRIFVPAGLTSFGLLIAGGIWFKPWVYPAIGAAGLLVGLLNYLRVSRKRSKRLATLRADREYYRWDDLAMQVKEVEVPETRIQYGWLGSRRYAHDDREEFAEELAIRAYEHVNGASISPSVMEKQHEQLRLMRPDLASFRDWEREQISLALLDRVQRTPHGLVPKPKLIEDTVEHDLNTRRFAPSSCHGYDPELVRECYRELVPPLLVEQPIQLEDSDDQITAVRHRGEPIPPGVSDIQAEFSASFSNYARWDPRYALPDVSERLEEEPVYADGGGA